jgi:hypothetical protein
VNHARRVVPANPGRPDLILPHGLSCLSLDLRTLNSTVWCFPAMAWTEAATTPIGADGGPS